MFNVSDHQGNANQRMRYYLTPVWMTSQKKINLEKLKPCTVLVVDRTTQQVYIQPLENNTLNNVL